MRARKANTDLSGNGGSNSASNDSKNSTFRVVVAARFI